MTRPIHIRTNGKPIYNTWQHSQHIKKLYRERASKNAPEMTCAHQAVDILRPLLQSGDSLLDAGCGAGHFFHSLENLGLNITYFGVDPTSDFIDIGREELVKFGLNPTQLICASIEDLDGEVDFSICLNVLSNLDNYHRPLERLLKMSRKAVLIRESMSDHSSYNYVHDAYLDAGAPSNVHMNDYGKQELSDFVNRYGFDAQFIVDKHSGGKIETVIGYPLNWTFMLASARSNQTKTTDESSI